MLTPAASAVNCRRRANLPVACANMLCGRFVVVAPPACDFRRASGGLVNQCSFKRTVAERAVEALDVAVLHWTAWLDQQVDDLVLLRPGQKGSRSELRPVVGTNRAG